MVDRLTELLEGVGRADQEEPLDHHYSIEPALKSDEWRLIRDGRLLIDDQPLYRVVRRLVVDLNRLVTKESSAFAVHAGAVARADSSLAFPAESGGGKSTIVAACLMAGFDYVSDEALLVDRETAEVIPYPKPIQLAADSLALLGREPNPAAAPGEKSLFAASALGGTTVTRSAGLRVSDVVIPVLDASTQPTLEPLPRSQIVASLLQASFNHFRFPAESFELCHRIARGVMRGVYMAVGGDITFIMENGDTLALVGMSAGIWHPMRFQEITVITTATGVVVGF